MSTPRLATCVHLLVTLVMAMVFSACQKKCGSATAASTQSFVGQEYRLVETNDPAFRNVTNYNFLIMQFDPVLFKGEVYTVKDNEKYNTPSLTFAYNVDPGAKILRIQYSYPQAATQGSDGASTNNVTGTPKDYQYSFSGRYFMMTDSSTGASYKWTPYTGAVSPDAQCTF